MSVPTVVLSLALALLVPLNGLAAAETPPVGSRKMCADPAGVMEQESAFLKVLETSMRVRIVGTRLELRAADGALALNATRAADR